MHDNINIENTRKLIQESLKFQLYPAAVYFKACFLGWIIFLSFYGQIYVENVACHMFLLRMSAVAY